MTIQMIDPVKANEAFLKDLEDAACEVIRSGKYILGKPVEIFEEQISKYLNVKHAIAVSSGTDALLMALMVYNIGPGDEVICPSFTFFATAGSIARVGAKPVFVDIRNDCFTLNVEEVRKAISSKTKAIMPVHLFGQSADMQAIMELAKEHNLIVIEDACQAIGAELNNEKVGVIGNVGCFSFFPTKNLGGIGDSGLIVTNHDDIADKLKACRVHGSKVRYYHDFIGGNFRIDTIQAAFLSVKLKYLPDQEADRAYNAITYYDYFLNNYVDPLLLSLPQQVRGKHVYNQYTVRVHHGHRDRLMNYLTSKNIFTAIYYPLPLHKQKCFNENNSRHLSMTETDLAAEEVLSLPISSEVSRPSIIEVASTIKEYFDSI